MSGDMWLVFIVACAGFGIYEVIKSRREKQDAPARPREGDGFAGARKGKPPHPHAKIIDLPGGGMRLIDLRGIPAEDLRIAQLGLVQEQLLLERPVPAQVWVAPIDIVRGWAKLEDVALIIMSGRFRDSRDPKGKNFIYPVGGTVTEAEGHKLQLAGVDIVMSAELVGTGTKIDDFLDPNEVWTASPDDRPVPPCDVISADPFDGKPIRIIEGFAFIDLRRLYPEGWTTGVSLDRLEKLFPTLVKDTSITHAVWVAAPWVLERIDEKATTRIDRLVDELPRHVEQRLAVMTPQNEPIGNYPLTKRIGSKLKPLAERLSWRTEDRGAFDVHPMEALHDAYFFHAWKQPRL